MKWRFTQTDHPENLIGLYQAVFQDPQTVLDFRAAAEADGLNLHFYTVKLPGADQDAGFAIFRGKGADVELWHCGVLQPYRRMGAGACILAEGERQMLRKGYSRIHISTYNRWHIMLSMLAKRGYRIVETAYSDRREDLRIELRKELRPKHELRYALTEKCNFRCLFCHNEGLGHLARGRSPGKQIEAVLKEAVRNGYTDITLTGGEPLLRKSRCLMLLDAFGRMTEPPSITLVTNASRMDDTVIEHLLRYPGPKKVHVSLHAADEKTFMAVTGCKQRGMFHRVVDQVKNITGAGIRVKMNHVVLRDLNHHRVAESIALASALGVEAIKLIELLVLPENHQDYRMYYDIDAIRPQIEEIAIPRHTAGSRQSAYHLKSDTRLTIELQRCTCALGCGNCLEYRDKTISSDLSYQPCFVRSRKQYVIREPETLQDIFRNGERIINGYAARFRNSSPTLVQKEQLVAGKREMFFIIEDLERLREFLVQKQFERKNITGFHEEYFRPRNCRQEWLDFRRVLKFGWNHHNQSSVQLVYTDHDYDLLPQKIIETSTRYLKSSGPLQFESAEEVRHLMDRLDFEKYLELEWSLETWEKKNLRINLSSSAGNYTLKIEGNPPPLADLAEILSAYGGSVRPLAMPLVAFMLQGKPPARPPHHPPPP